MLELSWFTDRIGTQVLRNNKPVMIKDEKYAEYYHSLQEHKFTYMSDTFGGTKIDFDLPEVVLKHSSSPRVSFSDSVCTSCES